MKIYRARHNGPFHLPPAEIESGGFFTIAQVAAWIAARRVDRAVVAVPIRADGLASPPQPLFEQRHERLPPLCQKSGLSIDGGDCR